MGKNLFVEMAGFILSEIFHQCCITESTFLSHLLRQLPYETTFSPDSGSRLSQQFHVSDTLVIVELFIQINQYNRKSLEN